MVRHELVTTQAISSLQLVCGGRPGLCAGLEVAPAVGCAMRMRLRRGKRCRSQPALRRASRSAPLPLGRGATISSRGCTAGRPCRGLPRCISWPLRATRLLPGKPRWSRLLWAGLRSEEACPRASLCRLPLLWLTFCSRGRIRQGDAQGFSGAPQKAHSQPNF